VTLLASPVVTIRPAGLEEVPALDRLVAASARGLGTGFYTAAETEAAIAHVFGIDTELVVDGSYLVAEIGGAVAGCGGWSRRRTLFGGDRYGGREAGLLDPVCDPARIRAFFVDPAQARRGVGSAILTACEEAARAAGFTAATLMATRPGVPFYAAHGYRAGDPVLLDLGGTTVSFVPMDKAFVA
jgi:GNAT superfamily N-acetyltransferase